METVRQFHFGNDRASVADVADVADESMAIGRVASDCRPAEGRIAVWKSFEEAEELAFQHLRAGRGGSNPIAPI